MKLRHSVPLAASILLLASCGVITDPADVQPEVYVESAETDPAAVAVFGQMRIDEAVGDLTAFVLDESFPPELLDPQVDDFTTEQLASESFTEALTPEAAQEWQRLIAAALDGDADAKDTVRAVRYYGVDEPAWTMPDGDPVLSQQITEIRVGVDTAGGAGEELMVVSFTHEANLEFLEDGEPTTFIVGKAMTFRLSPAPTGDGPDWLIAAFDGEFEDEVL